MATNNSLNTGTSPLGIANGGLGVSSVTAYGLIMGGETSTGPVHSLSVGTAGQGIISAGAGAWPAWGTIAGGLNVARLVMSTSDILNMYDTPVQVIAAPGASKQIMVLYANIEIVYNSVVFAVGGPVILQYGNAANGAGPSVTGGITLPAANVFVAATTIYTIPAAITTTTFTVADCVNKGVFISNQTLAFTTGNGSAVVSVAYYIQDV